MEQGGREGSVCTAIGDYAFDGCSSLSCAGLGGIDADGIYAVGEYGFRGTAITAITEVTVNSA